VQDEPRDRVLAAVVRCAGRVGLGRITVEEVAREAGVARASVYRWFPGGRDQLIDEGVTWEVGRFLTRIRDAVDDATDVATRLERGLVFAHRAIEDHEVLQHLLRTEPSGVLPQLRAVAPLVIAVIRGELEPLLEGEPLRAGVDPAEAAEVIARLFLSFTVNQGSWDLTDPAQVHELVRGHLLAGVLANSTQ
jgi:AcrR family transcriptional regulator